MYSLLIADDEPIIKRGIKTLIDFMSLNITEIFEASNGEEAIEIFNKNKPDLVFLDINMPKLDGLSVAKKIKLSSPKTKIVILTGYNLFDYAQSAIKIGVEDYILKPISKNEVSEILKKLIHSLEDRKRREIAEEDIFEENEDFSKKGYRRSIETIIEENFSSSCFNLSFLADKLGLSTGYLSVLFKKIFAITFQDYLLEKRMNKAKILLLTTELKNYEIADLIGFEDTNYFITKFKKFYNTTPKQYRESVISNEKT